MGMYMGQFPKILHRSPMFSLDKNGRTSVSLTLSSLLPFPSHAPSFPPTHFAPDMTGKPSPSFDWELIFTFLCKEITSLESNDEIMGASLHLPILP